MAHVPPRSRGSLRVQAERSILSRAIILPVQQYIYTESIGGLVLLIATAVAIGWANSPWSEQYHHILEQHLTLNVVLFKVELAIEEWINDGLMAIFFFVVALEIKRELLFGQLSSPRRASLPVIAAFGGMVVPAVLYLSLNAGGEAVRGWGIPMATDIAFALGALALLGRRVPLELRILLLGLAVVDDLGAIMVIAVAYSESLDFMQLGLAAILIGAMLLTTRVGFSHAPITAALAFLMWVAVLKSGVHATVAGVLVGALTPTRPMFSREEFGQEAEGLLAEYRGSLNSEGDSRTETILGEFEELVKGTESPLERLERLIHPWSSYVILPVFALANAGIAISADGIREAASNQVTLGVVLGLGIGKVVGITLFPWLASRFGLTELPNTVSWTHVIGIGLLGGIGFTVAIFIAGLAFEDPVLVNDAKFGIMGASLMAGLAGYALLRFLARPPASADDTHG